MNPTDCTQPGARACTNGFFLSETSVRENLERRCWVNSLQKSIKEVIIGRVLRKYLYI